MVLPLLGLLGAGLASTAALRWGSDWLDRRQENALLDQRSERTREALGGLLEDPNAGQFDIGSALLQGGLLSPGDFMSTAFGQENQLAKFGLDQMLAGDAAARERAKLDEGRLYALDEAFQPRFDALTARQGQLGRLQGVLTDFAGLGPTDASEWFGTPEGQQAIAQLQEYGAQDYFSWEQQLTGGTEPNDETRRELREAYDVVQGLVKSSTLPIGESGRFVIPQRQVQRAIDVINRRLEDVRGQGQDLQREYYRNRDRVRGGGLQIPGDLAGGLGVTASSRNLIDRESGGNWGATNREGMVGRAQFSPGRLDEVRRALGVDFSEDEFLRSPGLQRVAEAWHFQDIDDFMEGEGLDTFAGSTIKGIPVTWQGMRNVAHLGGKAGLARFLATDGRYDPADSNGTHLSDYLALGARG